MSASQDTPPYAELLPDLYRFAFLMTGSAEVAAEVLRLGAERAARTLQKVGEPGRAKRWLFAQARLDCSAASGHGDGRCIFDGDETRPGPEAPVPAVYNDQPRQLALVFAVLPESERCALALFYLYALTPGELGEVMDLKPQELGPLLSRGRSLLQRSRTLNSDLLINSVPVPI